VRRETENMLPPERLEEQTRKRMGRNRNRQDSQQLRQQDNGARKCKQPDEFKFRVGGRVRGVPLILRFNYRVRQQEGDQAYKNHDLESFAGHDRL